VKSISGSLDGEQRRFALLPPLGATAPSVFSGAERNNAAYWMLLSEMQRFRGAVYLEDGAISRRDFTLDGRHALDIDTQSWHLLALDQIGRICGCVRILEQTNARRFDELWISNCALAGSPHWSARLRKAVESEMTLAGRERIWFAEVGGLAIAPDRRCTTLSLATMLATSGLLQLLGGARCVATVTTRHGCAPILRRMGVTSLTDDGVELPSYYDPQYGCEMQVLRFDTRFPNPKFTDWIYELSMWLTKVPVFVANSRADHTVLVPAEVLRPEVRAASFAAAV